MQIILKDNTVTGVFSFTTGFVPTHKPSIRSEYDVLARAMWLERHGRQDEAEILIETWCNQVS